MTLSSNLFLAHSSKGMQGNQVVKSMSNGIETDSRELTNSEFMMKGAGLKTIKLNEPNKERGLPFMETLSVRASTREWSDRDLSLQDISDLLWTANGINRPGEKKCTASSAQNAHDVDVYVFMQEGVYLYDADNHVLEPVLAGDFRLQLMMPPPPKPEDSDGPSPPPPHPIHP